MKKKSLNTTAFLFIILGIILIASYLIPSGTFQREMIDGRNCVIPGTYESVQKVFLNPLNLFYAIPQGMTNAVGLMIGFLCIGGTIEVISYTQAINVGVSRLVKKLGIEKGNIVLVAMYYIFAVLGGFLGFVEGSIPFFPIAISISIALGYDGLVGASICLVGAVSGFFCGPTNPSSVAIAQTIAGVPMFSGMGFRLLMFAVLPLIGIVYILRYAKKVKADPSSSYVNGYIPNTDTFDIAKFEADALSVKQILVLLDLIAGLSVFVYGAAKMGWGFNQMSAIFIAVAIIAGFICRMSVDDLIQVFIKGASGMTNACFIIGLCFGMSWILSQANVLDTIVYYISNPLGKLPAGLSLIGIFIAITLVNLLIPSGSAKAAIMMPLIVPICDLVGLNAQLSVLCYQLGDGITNLCTPLSGTTLLVLSMINAPLSKWEKFILPLVGIFTVGGFLFLLLALQIGYN